MNFLHYRCDILACISVCLLLGVCGSCSNRLSPTSGRMERAVHIVFTAERIIWPYTVQREVDIGNGITEWTWHLGSLVVLNIEESTIPIKTETGQVVGVFVDEDKSSGRIEIGVKYGATVSETMTEYMVVPEDPKDGIRYYLPIESLWRLERAEPKTSGRGEDVRS